MTDPANVHGDESSNLSWNQLTWGNKERWIEEFKFGYRWGFDAFQQGNSAMTRIAEKYLHPHLGGRIDLKILELAPGGGRFTAELVRVSKEIHLMDMNEACIELCRERFQWYPFVKYYVNDGKSCDVVPDIDFDLIACYDSMVHMAPSIIENYVIQLSKKLKINGFLWLDHAGKGASEKGSRTNMSKEQMASIAEAHGLLVAAQYFRNGTDCISVLMKLE